MEAKEVMPGGKRPCDTLRMTPPKKVRPACSSTRGVMPPDTTLMPDDGWLEWLVPMRAVDPPASDGLAAPGPPDPALLLSPPQEEFEVEYTPLELTPDLPPPHSPPNLGCSAAHRVSSYNGTASMGGHDVGMSSHPSWELTAHPYLPLSFPAPHPPPHLSSSAAPQVPARNRTALLRSHDAGVHPTSPTSHPSWQPTAYPYPDVRPQSEHRPLPHGATDTSKGTVT